MSEQAAAEIDMHLRARAQELDKLDRSILLADAETFLKMIEGMDDAATPVEIEGMKRILHAKTPWGGD